jgi:hypothetical protein
LLHGVARNAFVFPAFNRQLNRHDRVTAGFACAVSFTGPTLNGELCVYMKATVSSTGTVVPSSLNGWSLTFGCCLAQTRMLDPTATMTSKLFSLALQNLQALSSALFTGWIAGPAGREIATLG